MLALHIGLPKTATTFLQSRVFARADGVALAHRGRGRDEKAICSGLRACVTTSGLRGWLARRRLAADLARFAARAAPRRVVVSNENVAISSTSFWLGEGPSPEQAARRIGALARRLGPGLAPVRVLLGVRRQDQWFSSRYAESSKRFPEFCQADFDRRLEAVAAAPSLDGPLGWLDHDRVRRAFAAGLGAESVFILPLERLEADEAGALEDLGKFLGVELTRRQTAGRGSRRHRRANQLGSATNTWRLRRDGGLLRLSDDQASALTTRFAESNAALHASGAPGLAGACGAESVGPGRPSR